MAWRAPPTRPVRRARPAYHDVGKQPPPTTCAAVSLPPPVSAHSLPEAVLAALVAESSCSAEKAQAVHQLNTCFFEAQTFQVVEAMAHQACRPDVFAAACGLLASGDPLGWMVLILMRYVSYCDDAQQLFVQQGALGAVVGVMRGWGPADHRVRLGLESVSLLLGRVPVPLVPAPSQERVITAFVKCGGSGMLCVLLKAEQLKESIRSLVMELIVAVSRVPAGRLALDKCRLRLLTDGQLDFVLGG
jgi:hypothetical protein